MIFIHIPKCGGTSVEDCLWTDDYSVRSAKNLWMGFVDPMHNKYQTGGLQHLTAKYIQQEVGSVLFDRCFKFTVCRDPLDRIISQFRFMKYRKDLREFVGLPEEYDFNMYIDHIKIKPHVQWMPQVNFLIDEFGKIIVDKIYYLEEISIDFSEMRADLRLDIKSLPLKNSTPNKNIPILSNSTIDRVFEIFEIDYKILEYSMDISKKRYIDRIF